jgi:hypothetical protein
MPYNPVPGMLVRCVDDHFEGVALLIAKHFPVRNIIYTVRELVNYEGIPALLLEEIRNPPCSLPSHQPIEAAFILPRFVPVDPSRLEVFRRSVERVDA